MKFLFLIFCLFLTGCISEPELPTDVSSQNLFKQIETDINNILVNFVSNSFAVIVNICGGLTLLFLLIKISLKLVELGINNEFSVKSAFVFMLRPLFIFALVSSVLMVDKNLFLTNVAYVPKVFEEMGIGILNASTKDVKVGSTNDAYAIIDQVRSKFVNDEILEEVPYQCTQGKSGLVQKTCIKKVDKGIGIVGKIIIYLTMWILVIVIFLANIFLNITLQLWILFSPVFIFLRFFDIGKEVFNNFLKVLATIGLQKALLMISVAIAITIFSLPSMSSFFGALIGCAISFLVVTGAIKLGSAMLQGISGGSSANIMSGARSTLRTATGVYGGMMASKGMSINAFDKILNKLKGK